MPDREWFTVETPNRPDAQVSVWTPEGDPRAIIQIFHGMAEHIDRYDRVARELTQKGYAVAGHNHKGHGPETPDSELGYFYAKDGWRKIVEDGHAISEWLKKQPCVKEVFFVGSGMISFYVDSKEKALSILKNIRLVTFAESLGGTESLLTYPTLQTHPDVPAAQKEKLGINDRLLRMSVGIEAAEDIINDLKQAMEKD